MILPVYLVNKYSTQTDRHIRLDWLSREDDWAENVQLYTPLECDPSRFGL